jgi:hypothetical protein
MDNKNIFKTNKKTSLSKKIIVKFYGIAPFIAAIYVINVTNFDVINKWFFSTIVGILIIYYGFFRKRDRQILEIQISHDTQEVYLQYCQYILVHTIIIPLDQLDYTYAKELYGYKGPLTLVFYKSNSIIAQIVHKYSGWSDENIKALYECLLQIKPPSNEKRIYGGTRLKKS